MGVAPPSHVRPPVGGETHSPEGRHGPSPECDRSCPASRPIFRIVPPLPRDGITSAIEPPAGSAGRCPVSTGNSRRYVRSASRSRSRPDDGHSVAHLRDHLAAGIEDPASSRVRRVGVAPTPVDADDVRLVLDRARRQQGKPVRLARGGPVRDHDEEVRAGPGRDPEHLREAQVVADERGDAEAAPRERDDLAAAGEPAVLPGERERVDLAVTRRARHRRGRTQRPG